MSSLFLLPLLAFFFYQIAIVDFKGWSDGIVAAGLSIYAIAGALSTLMAGPLIDKYRAKAFFPWYLIPFFFLLS